MKKDSTITFKVDEDLHEFLKSLPNRSEFIRTDLVLQSY